MHIAAPALEIVENIHVEDLLEDRKKLFLSRTFFLPEQRSMEGTWPGLSTAHLGLAYQLS